MKRIISIIMVLCFVFYLSATSTFASSNSEYIKVKKSTYQKYKNAYQKNKKLQNTISTLQKENNRVNKQLIDMTVQYEDAMDLYELAVEDADKQHSINDWLWNSLSGMNIKYKNKTWTINGEIPNSFYIRGTEYTVIRKE